MHASQSPFQRFFWRRSRCAGRILNWHTTVQTRKYYVDSFFMVQVRRNHVHSARDKRAWVPSEGRCRKYGPSGKVGGSMVMVKDETVRWVGSSEKVVFTFEQNGSVDGLGSQVGCGIVVCYSRHAGIMCTGHFKTRHVSLLRSGVADMYQSRKQEEVCSWYQMGRSCGQEGEDTYIGT